MGLKDNSIHIANSAFLSSRGGSGGVSETARLTGSCPFKIIFVFRLYVMQLSGSGALLLSLTADSLVTAITDTDVRFSNVSFIGLFALVRTRIVVSPDASLHTGNAGGTPWGGSFYLGDQAMGASAAIMFLMTGANFTRNRLVMEDCLLESNTAGNVRDPRYVVWPCIRCDTVLTVLVRCV